MRLWFFARHYPPAVSGGSRRAAGLARGLAALGVDVFVIAPDAPGDLPGLAVPHPNRDPNPSPTLGPPSLRDRAREALLVPDADIRWSRRAAAIALASGQPAPDWVFTTSPPESLHAAGLIVKRATGARWAADFRDSWLEAPLAAVRRRPGRRWREARFARTVLGAADLVTAVHDRLAGELERLAPGCAAWVLEQFAEPPPPPDRAALGGGEQIALVHTGSFSLSDPDRTIEPVLAAFNEARLKRPALRLHLVGRLSHAERGAAERTASVVLHGIVPEPQARALQAAADGLVLVASPGTAAVPGKLFEYRAAGRPIAVYGGGDWTIETGLSGAAFADQLVMLADQALPTPAPPPSARDAAEALLARLHAARA